MIAIIWVTYIVNTTSIKYIHGSWFRILGSEFDMVNAFYKQVLWLNQLICG